MDKVYEELFRCLRSALHGLPCGEMAMAREVMREAKRQTVDGLLLGVKDLRLTGMKDEERKKWAATIPALLLLNNRSNVQVAWLSESFDVLGIRHAVMKGQTCARFYSEPGLRRPGDIDVYVAERDFQRADDFLRDQGFLMTDRTMLHTTWVKDKLDVEVHWAVQKLQWPAAYKALQRMTREEVDSKEPYKATIGGYEVSVLPPTLNIVLLTTHAFNHVVSGGLGLRQICDWAVVLKATRKDIDFAQLKAWLDELHLMRMYRVLACLAVRHLGYAEDEVRLIDGEDTFSSRDERMAVRLLGWVKCAANFGHDMNLGEGKLRSIRYYSLFLYNCLRFFWLSPTEMVAWPWMKLWRGVTGKNHLKR